MCEEGPGKSGDLKRLPLVVPRRCVVLIARHLDRRIDRLPCALGGSHASVKIYFSTPIDRFVLLDVRLCQVVKGRQERAIVMEREVPSAGRAGRKQMGDADEVGPTGRQTPKEEAVKLLVPFDSLTHGSSTSWWLLDRQILTVSVVR